MSMKIIATPNHKGGVGKTTVSRELAMGLARMGKTVMLVDADAQATLTMSFGLAPEPGFYDLLKRSAPFSEVVKAVYQPEPESRGLVALVPGNQETRNLADSISDFAIVLERFQQLQSVDFVIFDTPPTDSLIHAPIYLACDAVLHPTECEKWSLQSLERAAVYVSRASKARRGFNLKPIQTAGILPNKVRNTVLHRDMLEELEEKYPGLVWDSIAHRIAWAESAMLNQSVVDYEPGGEAAKEARAMLRKFMEVVDG